MGICAAANAEEERVPAKTEKQRRLMMLAMHSPEKVSKKNRAVLQMSKDHMAHYATLAEMGSGKKR